MPVNITAPKFTEHPFLWITYHSLEKSIQFMAYVCETGDKIHKWWNPNRNKMITMMNGDIMSEREYDAIKSNRTAIMDTQK